MSLKVTNRGTPMNDDAKCARIDALYANIHRDLQELGGLTGALVGDNTIDHFSKLDKQRVALCFKLKRPVKMSEVVG